MNDHPSKPTVAIAGASGFVGTALRRALQPDYHIVALTRSPNRAQMRHPDDPTEWRLCDLFSLSEVTEALRGVDYAFYLVHSMLPSSRLTQAHFMDLDLLLSDNFGRAAEANQLQQIVYLGGLLPDEPEHNLSRHLRSRLEVEQNLYEHQTPVSSLRAGLIVGPGGSSLRMMVKLVQRLPLMVLPSWTQKQTQPIALRDVMRAMRTVLGNPLFYDQVLDIGGPEVMTYRQMMERTAAQMDRKRYMLPVPLASPRLSKYWVVSFSGSSMALTGPLVESLRHNMVAQPNALLEQIQPQAQSFDEALQESLNQEGKEYPNPRKHHRKKDDQVIRQDSYVRSVQRLPLPDDKDAYWVAREYLRWLPRFVWPFLKIRVSAEEDIFFHMWPLKHPLLKLRFRPDHSPQGRQLFFIMGGMLAQVDDSRDYGRLEFREVLNKRFIIAAIHKFKPRLPWYFYNMSQALVHLLVMIGYRYHLRKLQRRLPNQPKHKAPA